MSGRGQQRCLCRDGPRCLRRRTSTEGGGGRHPWCCPLGGGKTGGGESALEGRVIVGKSGRRTAQAFCELEAWVRAGRTREGEGIVPILWGHSALAREHISSYIRTYLHCSVLEGGPPAFK